MRFALWGFRQTFGFAAAPPHTSELHHRAENSTDAIEGTNRAETNPEGAHAPSALTSLSLTDGGGTQSQHRGGATCRRQSAHKGVVTRGWWVPSTYTNLTEHSVRAAHNECRAGTRQEQSWFLRVPALLSKSGEPSKLR